MAIIKNVEIWYAKLDPKHPNKTFNKENPTWELQLRTTDVAIKKQWEDLGLQPKLMKYKDDHEDEALAGMPMLNDDGKKQYRVNLQKRSKKKDTKVAAIDWEDADPVKVCDGSMNDIDPNTIGNGSLANVRVYITEYTSKENEAKISATLMAVQLVKHIVYKAKPRDDDFDLTETETIVPEIAEDADEGTPPKKAKPTPTDDDDQF